MAFNLTSGGTGATFDTASPKFGTGDLNGGIGISGAGALGSGPTFTWECWAKRSAIPGTIQALIGSSSAGWIGINTSGFAAFNGATGNVTLAGTVSICDGNYHHFAMVSTSSGFTGYVDGVSIGSSATAQPYASSAAVGVGGFNNGAFPCTSCEIDEVAFWNFAKWTANFTPPTAAYLGTESGLIALYHLDSTLNDSNTGTVSIAPNNAGIVYSPYDWAVTSGAAQTIDAGASFRTLFSGNSVVLNFNVANNSTPLSEIYYRIDGYETQAPWTRATVAASITPTMPTDTSAFPYHYLEVVVKSTSQTINRWNAPSNTAVVFAGLTLGSGAVVVAPQTLTKKILIYGDSITESVRTVNQTAANDPDQNDVMMGWAFSLGKLLGAEVSVVGFGSSGLTVIGSGNVPVLATSYNLLYAGQARSFTPAPSLIVLNEGTNDSGASGATFTAAYLLVLNGLLAACPGTPIAAMRPFNGTQATAIQAAIASCNSPSLVTYVDTTGYFNQSLGDDSTGFHPSGPNDLAMIAPQVANALRPLLNPRRFNISVTS